MGREVGGGRCGVVVEVVAVVAVVVESYRYGMRHWNSVVGVK